MDFYDRWILPPLLDLVMRRKDLTKYRRAAVAAAHGRVLEIGVGSGLNFPLYGKQVELVYGIDPSSRLLSMARPRAAASAIPIKLLCGSATAIPLATNTRLARAPCPICTKGVPAVSIRRGWRCRPQEKLFKDIKSASGRFCCKTRLRQAAKRDSVMLTRISARSIHDGPSEE